MTLLNYQLLKTIVALSYQGSLFGCLSGIGKMCIYANIYRFWIMVPVNIIFSKSSHDDDDHLVTTGVHLLALSYQIFPVCISIDIRIQLWFFAAASLRSEKAKLLKERPALITGSRFYPQGNPRHHRHHCHHRHHLDHLDHHHLKEEVVLRLQPIICSDTSSHACFFLGTFLATFCPFVDILPLLDVKTHII